MFFRRGRLRAKTTRSLLIELYDQRYQWLLRRPIAALLAHGDAARFACSLHFLVDYAVQGLYLLNQRPAPEQAPWLDGDLAAASSDLPLCPPNLVQRLAQVMRLDDPAAAEVEARRLLWDIIDLTPRDKDRDGNELPVVAWLPKIAALEPQRQDSPKPSTDPLPLARRAVRIVWRLPGSRLAAFSGSVAAGHADLSSDIDISLFGLKLPQAPVRRSLIAATSDAPDDITQTSSKTYASDAFWLNARAPQKDLRLINVHYFLIEEALRLFEHPAPQSQFEQELLAHLSTANVLVDYESRGPDLLDGLQRATCRARPERMARASAQLGQALARLQGSDDSPTIFDNSVAALLALFQLLAARNDQWIVIPKWTAAWLDDLEHAPVDAHQRLSFIALLPAHPSTITDRARALRALADEISAL